MTENPVPKHLAERVARWLLEGPAQVRCGVHAGAVAGILSSGEGPRYVYPEITGYYLQWLAWRQRHSPSDVLAPRAVAAQEWLGRWLGHAKPPTRLYLVPSTPDWRNHAMFTFDVAMALRGLASAARARLIVPDPLVVGGLCSWLGRLAGTDGQFEACITFGDNVLPVRWSTTRGPFLAKAAAGVLRAAETLPNVPPPIVKAAARTFDQSIEALLEQPHDELHPLLYAYEGALACAHRKTVENRMAELIAQFEGLCAQVQMTGRTPERRGDPDSPERIDVLAQMVRIAQLSRAAVSAARDIDVTAIEQRLAAAIAPNGTVGFTAHATATLNVWAAMFASQALAGMGAPSSDDQDGCEEPVDPLIV